MLIHKSIRIFINPLLLLIPLLLLPYKSYAGWYAGIDTTRLTHQIQFANALLEYDLNPTRFKTGYMLDSGFGVEMLMLGHANDDDTFGGNQYQFRLHESWGMSAILETDYDNYGLRGSLGFLSLDTQFTDVSLTGFDSDEYIAYGISFGGYLKLTKNLRATLDFSAYDGDAGYPSYRTNVGTSGTLDIDLDGVGLGISYLFY